MKIIQSCKLGEAEDILESFENVCEDEIPTDKIFQGNKQYVAALKKRYVYVPALNADIYPGALYEKDNDGEYCADFDIVAIFEKGECLYYENSNLCASVNNFYNSYSMGEIQNMDCHIVEKD